MTQQTYLVLSQFGTCNFNKVDQFSRKRIKGRKIGDPGFVCLNCDPSDDPKRIFSGLTNLFSTDGVPKIVNIMKDHIQKCELTKTKTDFLEALAKSTASHVMELRTLKKERGNYEGSITHAAGMVFKRALQIDDDDYARFRSGKPEKQDNEEDAGHDSDDDLVIDTNVVPRENDITFASGIRTSKYDGANAWCQAIVKANFARYQAASKREKLDITLGIIQQVRDKSGRFLLRENGHWKEVEEFYARLKIRSMFGNVARSSTFDSDHDIDEDNGQAPLPEEDDSGDVGEDKEHSNGDEGSDGDEDESGFCDVAQLTSESTPRPAPSKRRHNRDEDSDVDNDDDLAEDSYDDNDDDVPEDSDDDDDEDDDGPDGRVFDDDHLSDDNNDHHLSEYERQRAQNIRRNNARLAELGLLDAKTLMRSAPVPKQKRHKDTNSLDSLLMPRRSSISRACKRKISYVDYDEDESGHVGDILDDSNDRVDDKEHSNGDEGSNDDDDGKVPENSTSPTFAVAVDDSSDGEDKNNSDGDENDSGNVGEPDIVDRSDFSMGDIVNVQARTWKGIYKPGGVARITRVHPEGFCNVAYVLGGKESNVDSVFVSKSEAATDSGKRTRRETAKAALPTALLQTLAAEGFDTTGACDPQVESSTKANTKKPSKLKDLMNQSTSGQQCHIEDNDDDDGPVIASWSPSKRRRIQDEHDDTESIEEGDDSALLHPSFATDSSEARVREAAKCIGWANVSQLETLFKRMREEQVLFAWQLPKIEWAQWESLGAPIGLVAAIRQMAEIHPNHSTHP